MANLNATILNLLRRMLKGNRLDRAIIAAETAYKGTLRRHLASRLAKCGMHFECYWPVVIEHPEKVEVGERVSFGSYLHIWGHGGVYIGNRVMIASHVVITSLTHDYTERNMRSTILVKPVNIEDDVWIGTHAVILPGITIGCGAVIGAGAIVTHDVAADAIVAGVPAYERARRPKA